MSPSIPKESGPKRKLSSNQLPSRKKSKTHHRNADELPWKTVKRPAETGINGDDGILELEEVEGVEVVYETTEGGRVVKFNVLDDPTINKDEESGDKSDTPEPEREDGEEEGDKEEPVFEEGFPSFDSDTLLPAWQKFSLHPKIKKALHEKGFLTPTAIQSASLPFALADRDVVGIAQTGSGKTLAYGLPILHYMLSRPRPSAFRRRPLKALVLAPTRELALQVSSHLNSLLTAIQFTKDGEEPREPTDHTKPSASSSKASPQNKKPPPHVSIAAIVGGMSAQKQRRVIDRGVDVMVATPGRLWDILEDDDELARDIRNLRFLVLDEADRMIEAGHFAELENIVRLTLLETQDEEIPGDEEQAMGNEEEDTKEGVKDGLQTFVFSATLSKELQRNVKKKFRPKGNKKHYKRDQKPATTLDELLLRLDFRDPNPEVIDLSPVGGVVSTLKEGKIECLSGDKDVYLYYFLLRYPGKSLVFLSSIDGIRRLMPLVELLNINAYPLHSQLEQRQRLKNLDKFTNTPNSVLLATDIAARGLDIPAVDHVIHFQIPRSADTYIHRNGRTARAMRKGFSMLMVAPDERRVVKALLGNLSRDEAEIPEVSVELSMLDKLKARVQLARKIENTQHKIKKTNHDRNWMRETAEVLGVDLDSDFMSDSDNEEKVSNQKKKAKDHKMAAMKAELKHMLSQPLLATGISTRYITSGSRLIVDDLLAGEFNEGMVGFKKADAGSEMRLVKKKKKGVEKKSIASVNTEEAEQEWTGITEI